MKLTGRFGPCLFGVEMMQAERMHTVVAGGSTSIPRDCDVWNLLSVADFKSVFIVIRNLVWNKGQHTSAVLAILGDLNSRITVDGFEQVCTMQVV